MTTPDRFKAISELFESARHLAAGELGSFLNSACGSDHELRSELEALLKEYNQESPLDVNTPGEIANLITQSRLDDTGVIPVKVDRYTIVKQIGEGGMGSVYVAKQQNPTRSVALKVIKPGLDSNRVIARFNAERETLARMDHPCIAQVFDAGTSDDGRPYFAMELVNGTPITEYCDTHSLGVHARLDLFIGVCKAIQHAHQKGIIHRDIKPSNVLVTEIDHKPIPKVIDFGIAKATTTTLTEQSMFTTEGQLVGTPTYMSPEQAEMNSEDIDTRSDIYSLGVLLYELLTGTTPFTDEQLLQSGFLEMMRVIREDLPKKPSTRLSALGEIATQTAQRRESDPKALESTLSGDLDWIAMMCLEKDSADRYSSAYELSEDIRRYLSNEPIIARPHSSRYMISKLIKRNRGRFLAAGVVAAVLVLGIIGTTTGMIWAFREQANAQQSMQTAQDEALAAEAIVQFLLNDLLGAVDPARTDDRDITVRMALEIASESIEGRFTDQPKVEARVRLAIAKTLEQLGAFPESSPHYVRQLELNKQLYGPSSIQAIDAQHSLASNLMALSKFDEAIELTLEEIELLRERGDPDDQQLVSALAQLGAGYLQTGQLEKAAPILEESLVARRRALGDRDPGTLASMHNLSGLYGQLGKYERALELAREAYSGRIEVLGPGDPRVYGTLNIITWLLNSLERFDESMALLDTAIHDAKSQFGDSHLQTIMLLRSLANIYDQQGDFPQSELIYKEILPNLQTTLGNGNINTFSTMRSLAIAIAQQGRNEEALPIFRESYELALNTLPTNSVNLTRFMDSYASSLTRTGEFQDAESILTQAFAIAEKVGPGTQNERAMLRESMIELYTVWMNVNTSPEMESKLDFWKNYQSN